jgi:dUTP pyrophosphatase
MATATPTLKIKKLTEDAFIPEAMTDCSVGLDLAAVDNYSILPTTVASRAVMVRTGIAIELPKGYYATVHLRSSVGRNSKLRLANQVGIIDNDYRGEIILLVENVGRYEQSIAKGERFAQLIIHKQNPVKVVVSEELTETVRANGGFGSTN